MIYDRPEKYKISILNFMGWKEEFFSNDLQSVKDRAKKEFKDYTKPKDLMIYKKSPGFDNWTVIFSYWFHDVEFLDRLTDDIIYK